MASMEPFSFVEKEVYGEHRLYEDILYWNSAKRADAELQYVNALRRANFGIIVTAIPATNINLRSFAAAGFATCEVDLDTDSFVSLRGYAAPVHGASSGGIAETVQFAKYRYHWAGESFILYTTDNYQFVLKKRQDDEDMLGPSKATDALIVAIGNWMVDGVVWVFDNYWYQDKNLYQQVQKMSWDKVILDEDMKKDLTTVADKFFSSKQVYDNLGVPWKRGLMWYGPPGNGKTVSIKALMHTLLERKPAIPTLYVKSAPSAFHIKLVFSRARDLAPCMLVLEDIETIVTPQTRSYFFNQMDGLEDNSGLFVVATTNFLDRLDPGLSKRPSRFDRKYLFPIPNEHERELYCQYWRRKVKHSADIEFPEQLCPAMAKITHGFSFAFLQECFVATFLILAQGKITAAARTGGGDLDRYPLWREFEKQAASLRKQFEDQTQESISARQDQDPYMAPIPPHSTMSNRDAVAGAIDPPREDQGLFLQRLMSIRPDVNLPVLGNQRFLTINPACYEYR